MASVEPAGMIPNLNHSLGTGNSGALSSESSKDTTYKIVISFFLFSFHCGFPFLWNKLDNVKGNRNGGCKN